MFFYVRVQEFFLFFFFLCEVLNRIVDAHELQVLLRRPLGRLQALLHALESH